MNKAKAGLRGLNTGDKQRRASIIYAHMAGNPLFPSPIPSMLEFGQALTELTEANMNAMDRGRRALLRRDNAEEVISSMITRLAGYVNAVCLGDTLKILSAGFELAKQPEPISELNAPRMARARVSPLPKKLILRWARVPGAIMYRVEEATGGTFDNPQWTEIKMTSDTRMELDGRDKTQAYTFRVSAVGRRTTSPYATFLYFQAA